MLEEYVPTSLIEEYDELKSSDLPTRIIVLSAKNYERLRILVEHMMEFSECNKDIPLLNLAFTLQLGREAMAFRVAFLVSDIDELLHSLNEYLHRKDEDKEVSKSFSYFTGHLDGEYKEYSQDHFKEPHLGRGH